MNCFGTCLHTCPNCDVTCAQKCYAMDCFGTYFTHFTYVPQPGVGWGGGVGWGAMTCTVLAHIFDATQLYLRTCSMLCNCTCAHVRCYAIALAHMFDATQLHLRTCSMLRNCTCAPCSMLRNCICTHPRLRIKQWTWRAELLRVNPHLSKQQFLKHLAKVC